MIFRFYSGVDNAHSRRMALTHGLGLMLQPGSYTPERCAWYPCHAVDNGCFANQWDETRWLAYLERTPRIRCSFVVAPDVPFDWEATWQRSAPYVPVIRNLGFPVAVAVQNGATADTVPWDELDAVFIGGDTAWKLGVRALEISRAAHDRDKPVHMGRANSQRRFRRAIEMMADSADGTFLKYGPDINAPRLAAMLDPIYRADGHQLACA